MAGFKFVVYDPPAAGFPFLAVMVLPNGEIVVKPYATAAEAEAHNVVMANEASEKFGG